ncbi:unnamed protein product [Cyprideis torosa]|uniref:Uncharacterized protein n=1 Tax=Cyprideis torosa TaxID=163714 RepID=A0A7R8WJ83_9CRUS|nr:unnamed protein product [Cyprideis torosa]CAG0899751.1 unnamed protein product [Cyprideis torosa]
MSSHLRNRGNTTRAELENLKRMLLPMRVLELQNLLAHAGMDKLGRKNELLDRCKQLIDTRGHEKGIQDRVMSLYRAANNGAALDHRNSVNPAGINAAGPGRTIPPQHPMPVPRYPNAPATNVAAGFFSQPQYGLQQGQAAFNAPAFTAQTGRPTIPNMPHRPDIVFKRLPFYEVIEELLQPRSLAPSNTGRIQSAHFKFIMTPKQASSISLSSYVTSTSQEWTNQAQLRFCTIPFKEGGKGISEEEKIRDDAFPSGLSVKVNGKLQSLPPLIPTNRQGVEPRRPPKPLDMTSITRLSPVVPNNIDVSWTQEFNTYYAMAIFLVKKLTAEDLIKKIKERGEEPAENVRKFVRSKLDDSDPDVLVAESLRASVLCRVSKRRMTLPIRAFPTCDHIQCFDAETYINMNEKRPKWKCPVCDKETPFDQIRICGLFMEILRSNPAGDEVEFYKDGSWAWVTPPAPVNSTGRSTSPVDEGFEEGNQESADKKKEGDADETIVILDSDDESMTSTKTETMTTPPPQPPAESIQPPPAPASRVESPMDNSGGPDSPEIICLSD